MPITKSAQKALRNSLHKQENNTRVKSQMKTAVKTFTEGPTAEKLKEAYSRIDRAVKNNLLHRNKAARQKSQLAGKLKASAK